jgi:hypothetical protein
VQNSKQREHKDRESADCYADTDLCSA